MKKGYEVIRIFLSEKGLPPFFTTVLKETVFMGSFADLPVCALCVQN